MQIVLVLQNINTAGLRACTFSVLDPWRLLSLAYACRFFGARLVERRERRFCAIIGVLPFAEETLQQGSH